MKRIKAWAVIQDNAFYSAIPTKREANSAKNILNGIYAGNKTHKIVRCEILINEVKK